MKIINQVRHMVKKKPKTKFLMYLAILMFGWCIGNIHNYYNPNFVTYHAARDPEFGLRLIKEIIGMNQALNDATAVITTQSATQFGKEFFNTITNEGRPSIIAHPYDKQGSGVTVAVSYRNAKTNQRKILLVRKLKKRNTLSKGLNDEYVMVAGYTKGAAVEGGQISKLTFKEGEERDAVEDEYLITGALKRIAPPKRELKEETTFATKHYFKEIKKPIVDFFTEKLKKDPYIANFDPLEVKAYLQKKGFTYNRDYNYIDTAMREFKEESGYNGAVEPAMFKVCYSSDNYAISNTPTLHTIVSYLVFDLGTLDKEPTIYPAHHTGEREPNSFQSNGTETGELVWAPTDEIDVDGNGQARYNRIPIAFVDMPVHYKTMKYIRDSDLNTQSKGVIVSREHLQQLISHMGLTHTIEKTTSEFGKKASKVHQFSLCLATDIGAQVTLNADTITMAWHACKQNPHRTLVTRASTVLG